MSRPPSYPQARRSCAVRTYHGVATPDPYDWLDDPASAESAAFLAAQKALATQVLAALPARAEVARALDALPKDPPGRLPLRQGGFEFGFSPSANGGARLIRSGGAGDIVLDPAERPGLEGMRLQPEFAYPSPSGRYVAAGLATPGSDWLALHLFDLETGTVVAGWTPTAHLVVAWSPDESGFHHNQTREVVTGKDDGDGVYRHRLGDPVDADWLVFAKPTLEGHAALPAIAPEAGLLLVKTFDFVTQDAGLHASALDGRGGFREILPFGAAFNLIGEHDGELIIETKRGARRGRVLAGRPRAETPVWREVVAEQDQVLELATHSTWSSMSALAGDRLLLTYVQDAAHRLKAFSLSGEALGDAGLPGLYTVLQVEAHDGQVEAATTGFDTPFARWRIDPQRLAATLENKVDAGKLVGEAEVRQIFCRSPDGTRIPVFTIRPHGAKGPLPTLLYGYGGWGQSITPSFRQDLAAWLAMGGAYAVANIRGGGEYGREWHEAGARLNRKKTFDDFCAAGEALIDQGVCAPGGLAIRGLSNGGLLVAAVVNQRPELFAAAAIGIPLVDVVNLMSLPAGHAIAAELGDPTADKTSFDYIASYSPLQNVSAAPHRPAIIITPAERDSRVSPAQAYKLAAALQATASGDQVVLLRVIEGEGHGGWPWPVQRELLSDELGLLWAHASKGAAQEQGPRGERHVAV